MEDCEKKKIDLILVNSVSRFGRDSLETISRIRKLPGMGIGIYFETGGLNTMTSDNITIEVLAAFAQAESESRSENIKFGIRQSMRKGNVKLNYSQFLGYTKS